MPDRGQDALSKVARSYAGLTFLRKQYYGIFALNQQKTNNMPRFEDGKWVYFSQHVPGYIQRYTFRGMRSRNKKLLERIALSKGDKAATDFFKSLLVENNLPLARAVAENIGYARDWSDDKVEDAFMVCCLAMQRMVNDLREELIENQGWFQQSLYIRMRSALQNEFVLRRTLENDEENEFIPFDENDFPTEDVHDKVNYRLLLRLLEYCSHSKRDLELLKDHFLRNMSLEEVGIRHDLTRERVRQIVAKHIRVMRKYCARRKLSLEDFYA